MTDVDYLVIGAGAMGMAFADTILTESDATVALVDRRPRPGGHWNDAYPHVRLHQPSSFYGVNSRVLGAETIDAHGWNEGLSELASGTEVVAYFDQVLRQQFLASGRAQFFPMSDYEGDGTFRSLLSGERTTLNAGKVVNAAYMNVTVPSVRPPDYDVADGVVCVPPNDLGRAGVLPGAGDRVVVVGAGKTAMDACLFLLEHGTPPDAITWIRPREQWCIDRATIQSLPQFFDRSVGGNVLQLQAVVESDSVENLFERLDEAGVLLRIDESVTPTMFRCATVSMRELDALRTISNVVRMGRVQRIEPDQIVLDDGTVETSPGTVHVDCTADGLARRPAVPVFDGDTLTLQTVRTCQQVFSAAFIAHVEVAYEGDELKNELTAVVPHPDSEIDFLRCTLATMKNVARWRADDDLSAWLQAARLNGLNRNQLSDPAAATPEQEAMMAAIQQNGLPAAMKLQQYVDDIDAGS